MSIDQKAALRLRQLIEAGEVVLGTKKTPGSNMIGFDSWVDSEKAHQWYTSSQNLLGRVFGTNSPHYQNFSSIPGKQALSYTPVRHGQGVLRAALDDFEQGYLFDIRRLIESEVFADILEQAKELMKSGYKGPAALVAGCVLEDGLRKLCTRHNLPLNSRPKLDLMNADLAKVGIYNKLTQKRITAIADIRNNAAHGKWDEFNTDDVTDMVEWISKFLETHLQ